MATIRNDRDISLQSSYTRTQVASITITGTSAVFTKLKNSGGTVPASITLNTSTSAYTAAAVKNWTVSSNIDPGTQLAVGSGDSKLISNTVFEAYIGDGNQVYITCNISEFGLPDSTASFVISYVKEVQEGTVRVALLEMYKWGLSVPSVFPSGTSTYTWSTNTFTNPTTPNGWSVTPPAPIVGETLWVCKILYSDALSSATTIVTWSTSIAVPAGTPGATGATGAPGTPGATGATGSPGTNGTEGSKSVTLSAFKWATSPPSIPTQSFNYTWSSGVVSSYPSGWAGSAPAAPGVGYILYQINLIVMDWASSTITNSNWSGAALNVIGYRDDGSIGAAGQSARTVFIVTTSPTAPLTPTAGSGDVVPTSGDGTWSFSATSTLSAGQYMYRVDGVYNPGGNTVWGIPYLATLKVGALSALSANLGVVEISSVGSLASTGKVYGDSGAGIFFGYHTSAYKFELNSSSGHYLRWNGSVLDISGDINAGVMSGTSIYGGTISGTVISAATLNATTINSGTINIQSDGYAGWGYIRSYNKWWHDGNDGWVLARDPTSGNTFFEIKGGNSKMWLSNWGDNGINFNNKFTIDNVGNVNIQSSTGYPRVEIKNNVIKVFDSAGTLRVQIGDLSI